MVTELPVWPGPSHFHSWVVLRHGGHPVLQAYSDGVEVAGGRQAYQCVFTSGEFAVVESDEYSVCQLGMNFFLCAM